MSMRSVVGLNKQLPSQAYMRVLASGVRGFHAARPAAVGVSKPRAFGGDRIYPSSGSYIQGTVNDPTQYPSPDRYHGSYHWAFERLVSVSLVPLCAVAAVKHGMSGAVDGALSVALLLHSHMGFENVLTDYVEKRKFPIAAPITTWFVRALTVATGIGLYEFNTNDIGLTELVAKLWTA
ncbi:membrane anchor subunit of succinate dehydrogenase, Sdh4 [Malassezia furfur]|uniref:Succinate dehydrogenase [ubiquinone] cytochrome b small subunit n=1 Tax=Malassezia furfur TaxID=55194 RepID=A0ABY8EI87_MALFU|nr:SDH4 [Malassezia furfur]WFD45503.1 membrane anchor subunit of succinate dehydrogenase, Sdh4 [Malassezia furfur]